ncbi:cytosine permease [Fredinandcohnia salidurans]|uniref:Cytosine permease n=1 Tax=Fredinandcohnia salidurans TaxID=2595041 RepID=A0ABW4MV11_9BACI
MHQKENRFQANSVFSEDLLPTNTESRTWKFGQFFSVWMGSVHNIPSYVTIGGFFALGLSIWQVFSIIIISSIILAALLVLNGHAGGKYGIPFAILLRTSYGEKGALVPGVLRGVIVAIMWFGLQTYAGSSAVTILIGKFWPDYLLLGKDWSFFGLNLPGLISFLLFWGINVFFIYAGIDSLGKLTKIITPLIFLVFGGMAIWAIQLAGGISPILHHPPKGVEGNSIFVFVTCVSAILATWVAQILSVSDITRYSRSNKEQSVGQITGIIATFLLFAVASITIITGSEVAFGVPVWNVLDVIDQFDSKFVIVLSLLTLCLATLSVNVVGNIIPAANQLTSLFPKRLGFKSSALLATIIGFLIMPWRLMESSTSIFAFLNMVGALLSPVIGVMLIHYYVICKREIHIDELYEFSTHINSPKGINVPAMLATILAGLISIVCNFVDFLKPLYGISSFIGIIVAVILYLSFYYSTKLQTVKSMNITKRG